MNERIKECWIKAAREDASETWDSQEQFIERFAQLIVRECGQWIVDNAGAMEHLGPEYFAQAMIKQHFGVER
jgi:hypothetical protein